MNDKDPDQSDRVDADDLTRDLSEDEAREIEEERARRLDPDNRPENSIVDNSDADLPTVRRFAEESDGDVEGSAGTSDPGEVFRNIELSEAEVAEIEAERQRRLAPENRPENTEVDNTGESAPEA